MKEFFVAAFMWLLLLALQLVGMLSWPWICVFAIPMLFLIMHLAITGLLAEHIKCPDDITKVP